MEKWKKVLLIVLAAFFVLAAAATYVSFQLYYSGLPVVSSAKRQGGYLYYEYSPEASLHYTDASYIRPPEGVTVSRFFVQAGEDTDEGGALMELDADSLGLAYRRAAAALDEETRKVPETDGEKALHALELTRLRSLADTLEGLSAAGGIIYSDGKYRVAALDEETGWMKLCDLKGAVCVRWQMNSAARAQFAVGSPVTAALEFYDKADKGSHHEESVGLEITSIRWDAGTGAYLFEAAADTELTVFGKEGDPVSVGLEHKSDLYKTIVPLSALTDSDSGMQAMILDERRQPWGTEKYVRFVSVTVLEENGVSAAVDGSISPADVLALSPGKALADGQAVRLGGE